MTYVSTYMAIIERYSCHMAETALLPLAWLQSPRMWSSLRHSVSHTDASHFLCVVGVVMIET
jgi:hypothetical protein